MYWRIGAAYRRRPARTNKAAFREVVRRGPPPGLLAFDGDLAVGWCQLTPREQVPMLDRARQLGRVDDVPVWSLSCFYVRKGYRRRLASCEARQGAGGRSLPLGSGSDTERDIHWTTIDVRPRRLQDGRSPGVASSDHAPRPEGRQPMRLAFSQEKRALSQA
jgi:hypothetical protein